MRRSPTHDQQENKNKIPDFVQRDALRSLGIPGWRRRTGDTQEWKCLWGKPGSKRGHRVILGWMWHM